MQAKKLAVKLLTLAVLVFGIFGLDSSVPVAAEICGKCDAVTENGQVIGYACLKVEGATKRCLADTGGCTFPEGKCDPPVGN